MGEFDDGLEGVLGSETPEGEGAGSVAGADAVALALALQKAGNDPALSRTASDYLAEQRHLVQIQIKHFDEERRLGIAAAKRKRYADYMRNGLYSCIALLVLGVLLAAVRMTVEAMSDHGLVVEDFTVPSDFAARGLTSQALAEDLASRVAAIRATALRSSLTYSGDVRADQSDVLKVQIPETGISVDELERFLHRWLGHQTIVNGELSEEAGGQISILLHVAGADPIVVSGSSSDLHQLMQTAAEKAFAIFDPDNATIYLSATGRRAEAYEAAVRNAQSATAAALSSQGRAGAYSLLASRDPDFHRALSSALVEVEVNPRELIAWAQAASTSRELGHDEAALDLSRRGLETRKRDQPASERNAFAWLMAEEHALIDQALGDFDALRGDLEVYDRRPNTLLGVQYAQRAQVAALLHDEASANQDLTIALVAGPADRTVLQARWDVSSSAGDWAQALDAAKAMLTAVEAQKSAAMKSDPQNPDFVAPAFDLIIAIQYRPLVAYAEAMTGDVASATALISQTPADCYLCVRMRARIAAAAGDSATADRWFAEAVRQAPDLPMAYFEWGQALLMRGDLTGAAREFSLAHDKGPHFADALKAWGDALAKQGHPKDALAKYDEALKYAPKWAALKQARDAAASRQT